MSTSNSADAENRVRRQYPHQALSKATSRRLLREMLQRAEGGDNVAATELIRLGRESRRTELTRTE
jgi:hypothetical protein